MRFWARISVVGLHVAGHIIMGSRVRIPPHARAKRSGTGPEQPAHPVFDAHWLQDFEHGVQRDEVHLGHWPLGVLEAPMVLEKLAQLVRMLSISAGSVSVWANASNCLTAAARHCGSKLAQRSSKAHQRSTSSPTCSSNRAPIAVEAFATLAQVTASGSSDVKSRQFGLEG